MTIKNLIKTAYIRTTGYSYTNLGRLFLRLFVGIMLFQFGVRQIANFTAVVAAFPSILGLAPNISLTLLILIEIVCSLFIMCGFLTRLMSLPPFIAMWIAETFTFDSEIASYDLTWHSTAYLPVMFMGIYFFIMLVGPGKISVDYFLSLHLIHSENKSEDEELEEV